MIRIHAMRSSIVTLCILQVLLLVQPFPCRASGDSSTDTTLPVDLGHVEQEVQGGLYLRQSIEDCLKADYLSRLIETFEPPMSSWKWDLQGVESKEGSLEFRYRIHHLESPEVPSEPTHQAAPQPTESGLWGYWSMVKNAAATVTAAAYKKATEAGGYAFDYLSERSLVGRTSVETTPCGEPFLPEGLKVTVNLINSDHLITHFTERAWIVLCFQEGKTQDDAPKLRVDLQMFAQPGPLLSMIEVGQAQEFATRFSRAWLDNLFTSSNFRQAELIRQSFEEEKKNQD